MADNEDFAASRKASAPSSPSSAGPETMESLKEELHRLQAKLTATEQSRDYCVDKAADYSSSMKEQKDMYEKYIADLQARHGRELKDVIAENARLKETVRNQVAAATDRANEVRDLEHELEKLQGYTKHDSRTVQSLIARAKSINEAFNELKKKVPEPLSKKRGAKPAHPEDIPRHKKPRSPRIIPCTQCIVHGWTCDSGAPCENCSLRSKDDGCKRVMCKFYNKHTCPNRQCTFAHEDDEFVKLVPYTVLKEKKVGPSPKEIKHAEELKKAKEGCQIGSKKPEPAVGIMRTEYDIMFDRLRKRKKDGDEGEDGPVPA